MSKEATANSVRVEIYDQSYHLRGTDPEYITRLGEYVDQKMRSVAEQTQTVDSLRLAVLAALNIADEYHLLKRKFEEVAGEHLQASRLAHALDEVLEEGNRRAG